MRMIKSVWTRPATFFYEGLEELTSLSILSLVKHTGDCEIFADDLGAEWIAALRLPIRASAISRALRDAPGDGYTWNEGKIYCNSIQTEPYIQTDIDVMIGRDWSRRIKSGSIITEHAYTLDHPWLSTLPLVVPAHWLESIRRNDSRAFACGTYGGNDLHAIRKIALIGLDFIARNRELLKKVDPYLGVIVAEEWAIVQTYDWMEVTTVIPSLPTGSVFAAMSKSYLHKVGKQKRGESNRLDVMRRLREISPGQAERCAQVRKEFASRRG